MSEFEEVCYTREGAIEKAIEMERESFDVYRKAHEMVEDKRARKLVKELALEGLEEGPSMELTMLLQLKPLDNDSTSQDVMIYAIHEEKRSVDFYGKMAHACVGAPMEKMFRRLQKDEAKHLASLEELYESIYMPEM